MAPFVAKAQILNDVGRIIRKAIPYCSNVCKSPAWARINGIRMKMDNENMCNVTGQKTPRKVPKFRFVFCLESSVVLQCVDGRIVGSVSGFIVCTEFSICSWLLFDKSKDSYGAKLGLRTENDWEKLRSSLLSDDKRIRLKIFIQLLMLIDFVLTVFFFLSNWGQSTCDETVQKNSTIDKKLSSRCL